MPKPAVVPQKLTPEPSKPKPVKEPQSAGPDVLDKWLRNEIASLFDVHFGSGQCNFSSLGSEGLLSSECADEIFVEILTELGCPQNQNPFSYLVKVYDRAFSSRRTLLKTDPLWNQKSAFLTAVIRLCGSYALISIQIPDMIINNDPKSVFDHLILEPSSHKLLTDVIAEAAEQDAVIDLANAIFPYLAARLLATKPGSMDCSNLLSLWEALVATKTIPSVFSQIDNFFPTDSKQGLEYEHKTILGPLLRLSPLSLELCASYFRESPNAELTCSGRELLPIFTGLQNEQTVLIDRIWGIFSKLVRGSTETRRDLLKWLADLVNSSKLRTGSYSDPKKLAGDGFMWNISILLIRLSLPFLKYPTYEKLNLIDLDYFGPKNHLLDVAEEPRLFSSTEESKTHYADTMDEEPNFVSECFFLTLAYLQYGIGGVIANDKKMAGQIRNSRQQVLYVTERMGQGNPLLKNFFTQMNRLICYKWVLEALSMNRSSSLKTFDFIIGAAEFLQRAIDPSHEHPKTRLRIPLYEVDKVSQLDDHDFLKTKAPKPWRYFPEYCLEGFVNYCQFIARFHGSPLMNNDEKLSILVELLIALLRCPELVGNPHLKGTIVEILFTGTIAPQGAQAGFLDNLLLQNDVVRNNLLYSLLDIYVIIEKTGASSQFYDKFNSRFYISKIIEHMWEFNFYKEQLSHYSSTKVDFFIRFIARMLNDTTFLFDESFNELNAIHNMQVELQKREAGEPSNEDEFGTSEELQKNLESAEKKARSYMSLANQTMKLFKLFTKQAPESFVISEIVDRLAGMLDYNLSLMVGPKCSNLKVKEPEKYEFDPKRILADICEIYYNLSRQVKFVQAVARDGRSFNFKLFDKARDILTRKTSTPQKVIEGFYAFGSAAEAERISIEKEDEELGEVPDEYLDPLMFTIMEDPVILPGSRVTLDRSTIKAHLLSDPTDPFNRMPLSLEDVIDDVEMKRKIDEFRGRNRS